MATRRTLVSRASYDRSLHVCTAGPARIVGGAGAAGKALRLGFVTCDAAGLVRL